MTKTVTMGKLNPLTDPIALRDRTMHDYAQNVRRQGGSPDMQQIEWLAKSDLGIVDRHNAEQRHKPKPKKRKKKKRRDDDVLATHERENNVKIHVRDAPAGVTYRSVLDMPADKVNERWSHAMARIFRILEPQSDIKGTAAGGYEKMAQEAKVPHLARDYVSMFAFYLVPTHRSKFNPFRGLNPKDVHRKFVRMVEDICDRSTGVLGPWYIK